MSKAHGNALNLSRNLRFRGRNERPAGCLRALPRPPASPPTATAMQLVMRAALLAGAGMAVVFPAAANPQGGQVVGGAATIAQPTANLTQVNQSSGTAIINWQSFNIKSGETTKFVQPSTSALAINRVTGADPSVIAGQLQANGRIALINQSGVFFSQGSQVNVNSLIVTTSDIKN